MNKRRKKLESIYRNKPKQTRTNANKSETNLNKLEQTQINQKQIRNKSETNQKKSEQT